MHYLDQLSRENSQLLVNRIFDLPTETHPTEAFHVLALLPKPTTVLPREKPVFHFLCVVG